MATARHKPPKVYQDHDASRAAPSSDGVESALLHALAPLSDASSKANVQLNSSTSIKAGSSPSKKDSSPPRPLSPHRLTAYKIPPPAQPHFHTDSPEKDADFYSMYHQVAPRPEHGLYPPYYQAPNYDKENVLEPGASFGDVRAPKWMNPQPQYGYKAPLKRTSTDSGPVKPPAKKQKSANDEPFDLPLPEEMPPVTDDGGKPQHSYAELIGMAILRAPNRRLTLAQIYKWISDNFTYYRSSEGGWQNSIRHNLSLNKNFIKQERPKDDPGKGNYWAIEPGQERPFLLGKKQPVRKMIHADGSQYIHSMPIPTPSDPAGFRPASAPAIGNFTLGPNPIRKIETKEIDSAKFPDEAELSSDGTIPASDPALQEDDRDEDAAAMPPPPVHFRSSPPPQDLGSSPPAFEPIAQREDTPPPAPRFPSSSRSRGERRKFAGLNDSGYWSSIESSAARGAAQQSVTEADVRGHRIRKGRAEAEIARMRSSSFDSPSKDQSRPNGLSAAYGSSPVHRDDNPLTPAVVLKRPARPPPSISPNTNLRDHRNAIRALLGSPAKSYSPMPNTWSPAFNLHDDAPAGLTPFISPYKQNKTPWRPLADIPNAAYNFNNSAFDIFIDAPEEDIVARGSPEKRSNRRPSLVRAATSTGILADITGTAKSNNLMLPPTSGSPFSLSPFLARSGSLRSPTKFESPLKQSHKAPTTTTSEVSASDQAWFDIGLGAENLPGPSAADSKDAVELFGVELHSDGSEEGIDIFQDFGKIGSASQLMPPPPPPDRSTGSPVKRSNMGPPARPLLGRSNTSRW